MNIVLMLLAAGDSRRFQGNKLLHSVMGKPMYRYIVDEVVKLPPDLFSDKIIVTQYLEIMEDLKGRGYVVVENHESSLGISHSIELGLAAMTDLEAAICFGVCDQPYLQGAILLAFLTAWKDSKKGIGCLCTKGELGNPTVFSGHYRQELLELQGDTGGKRVIRNHMDDLYLHEVEDDRELMDVDERIF